MEPRITARSHTLSTRDRSFVIEKTARLEQVYEGITDVHVVVEKEKTGRQFWKIEILASVFRKQVAGQARDPSFDVAVDRCVEKLRRQLLKHKSRLRRTA